MCIWEKRGWEKFLELTLTEIILLHKKKEERKVESQLDCEDIDTFEMERAYRSLAPGPLAEESCWAAIIKL